MFIVINFQLAMHICIISCQTLIIPELAHYLKLITLTVAINSVTNGEDYTYLYCTGYLAEYKLLVRQMYGLKKKVCVCIGGIINSSIITSNWRVMGNYHLH